jgi:hypothetical protein
MEVDLERKQVEPRVCRDRTSHEKSFHPSLAILSVYFLLY